MADTFLDILNQANTIVKQSYPTAVFYEADQADPASGNWRFVFNVPNPGKINGTALLFYVGGNFQKPPKYVDQPWLEDRVIPLPIKMDLGTAVNLATKAGYPAPYQNITLRWPLYPGVYEPEYIFGRGDLWVFVGIYDGKVSTAPVQVEALAGAYV
jgi:hypothetical protein